MSETWMAIIFASLAVYSWKVIGYLVPSHVLNHPRVSRIASLLTVVLLAALLGTQSFAAGSQISLDERVPALIVAALLLWLRAPFIVVVAVAAAVAGLLRLL